MNPPNNRYNPPTNGSYGGAAAGQGGGAGSASSSGYPPQQQQPAAAAPHTMQGQQQSQQYNIQQPRQPSYNGQQAQYANQYYYSQQQQPGYYNASVAHQQYAAPQYGYYQYPGQTYAGASPGGYQGGYQRPSASYGAGGYHQQQQGTPVSGQSPGPSSLAAAAASGGKRVKKPLQITDKSGKVVDFTKKIEKINENQRKLDEEEMKEAKNEFAALLAKEKEVESEQQKKLKPEKSILDDVKAEIALEKNKSIDTVAPSNGEALKEAVKEVSKSVDEQHKAASRSSLQERLDSKDDSLETTGSVDDAKTSLEKLSLRPRRLGPGVSQQNVEKKTVYFRDFLLSLRAAAYDSEEPVNLPNMDLERCPNQPERRGMRRSSSGTGGGKDWQRKENVPRRDSRQQVSSGGDQWVRGQRPPTPPRNAPPTPKLVRSKNRWMPVKSSNAVTVMEKKVKSILNKMTKEKYDKLSQQMLELPVQSAQVLEVMIATVFEKAIDEPAFADMYARLCALLGEKVNCDAFIHTIKGDQDGDVVFYWSSNISTDDEEIIGPFDSKDDAIAAAFAEEDTHQPHSRDEKTLALESLSINNGIFIKVLKDQESGKFFSVYFAKDDAAEVGQQLSEEFYLTIEDAKKAAKKQNSFRYLLVSKCQDEFSKQDIYVDWKKEKKEFDEKKSSLSDDAVAEKEEELNFRRIKIKKQMLGNIRFIGELYKMRMLKETVMHHCICSLLKLENRSTEKNVYDFKEAEDNEMDEEDHEALCKLFATIGPMFDVSKQSAAMVPYFKKITSLSKDKNLPTRSRFMYQDLIDMRNNGWKERRKQETAKTIAEIKKDFEREERQAKMQQASFRGSDNRGERQSRGGDNRGRRDDGRGYDNRRDSRSSGRGGSAPQMRSSRSTNSLRQGGRPQPDERQLSSRGGGQMKVLSKQPEQQQTRKPSPAASTERLTGDKLKTRIKCIRTEFMADGNNVDELVLTFEESSKVADNFGNDFSLQSIEFLLDCKENERVATLRIFEILLQKKLLKESNLVFALSDLLEFMSDFIIDIPLAYNNMARFLSVALNNESLSLSWLISHSGTLADKSIAGKLFPCILEEHSKAYGPDLTMKLFNSSKDSLIQLVGEEAWRKIASS